MRNILLSDGTQMGDELIVFITDAPVEELKNLEEISCQIYRDGGEYEDIPIWAEVLTAKGYTFKFVDSHPHVTPFNTSSEWADENYPEVTEKYVIDNQPCLS